jgi:phage tail-like protein
MATVLNNRSSIVTDPIRNFRFLVTFLPQDLTVPNTGTPNRTGGTDGATKYLEKWATNLAAVPFGFTSVSGLSVTTDSIPYREGGYNTTVHQMPGQTSFAPITLQRGVQMGSSQNYYWMRQLFNTVQGNNDKVASNFRCDLEIQVLSHPAASINNSSGNTTTNNVDVDHVAIRIKVYNAWITSLSYSDLNAGDNAIYVEQMTLVHEGFDVTWADSLEKSAAEFTN